MQRREFIGAMSAAAIAVPVLAAPALKADRRLHLVTLS